MKYVILTLIFFFLATLECYAESSKGKCVSGDCQNGNGIFQMEDGKIYIGQFKNSEFCGQGTAIAPDINFVVIGQFKNNNPHGQATFITPEGKFVAKFQKGVPHGLGTAVRVDGSIIIEEYDMGKLLSSKTISQGKQPSNTSNSQLSPPPAGWRWKKPN